MTSLGSGLALPGARGLPVGSTGAAQPTRFVGKWTQTGAPTSGTYAVGDFGIDAVGDFYTCTVAGTPGTWRSHGSGTYFSVFETGQAVPSGLAFEIDPLPVPDTTAPTAPTVAAVASDTQVTLTASGATDAVGVTGYRFFRNAVQIADQASAVYTDTGLTNGTTYTYTARAYDAAGNVSALSSSVTATPALGANMLTLDEATVETSAATWTPGGSNTAVSRSTTKAAQGSASLALTANGTGGMNAFCPWKAVTSGQTYSALASVSAGTTGRSAYVIVEWSSDGSTLASASVAVGTTDSSGSFTDLTSGGVLAPAGVTHARVKVGILSATPAVAGEVHYYDKIGLFSGNRGAGSWTSP